MTSKKLMGVLAGLFFAVACLWSRSTVLKILVMSPVP